MRHRGFLAAAALGAALTAAPALAQDAQAETKTEKRTETTETVSVNGTVQSYDAGKSITIQKADGTTVTYTVNAQSMVPPKLATGKTVTVRTTTVSGAPVVQRVTYTTTTTTTTK